MISEAPARRTLYESRGLVNRRRRRKVLTAASVLLCLAIVAGVAALVLARGDAAQTKPRAAQTESATPPASPRPVVLSAATVHRGEAATVRYRIAAPAGTSWDAQLVIRDAHGARVKVRRLRNVPAGRIRSVTMSITLPVGRYHCLVRVAPADGAGDAAALAAGAATPGVAATTHASPAASTLVVLKELPPAFPGRAAVAKALAWAAKRSGEVSVAVIDSRGKLTGLNEDRPFQTASLAKAILLAAYLRKHPRPAPLDAVATKMIEESDNASADTILGDVGHQGMRAVVKLAGLNSYRQGTGWIDTRLSAADAARLFFTYESFVPKSRRAFARTLLAGITPMQRWGIAAAAGPAGWSPHFKSGWLGLDNHLVVQAAWLEKGGQRWALAVMTDDNPDRSAGWDTQKGVAGLLLGQEPTPAYLSSVLED